MKLFIALVATIFISQTFATPGIYLFKDNGECSGSTKDVVIDDNGEKCHTLVSETLKDMLNLDTTSELMYFQFHENTEETWVLKVFMDSGCGEELTSIEIPYEDATCTPAAEVDNVEYQSTLPSFTTPSEESMPINPAFAGPGLYAFVNSEICEGTPDTYIGEGGCHDAAYDGEDMFFSFEVIDQDTFYIHIFEDSNCEKLAYNIKESYDSMECDDNDAIEIDGVVYASILIARESPAHTLA